MSDEDMARLQRHAWSRHLGLSTTIRLIVLDALDAIDAAEEGSTDE